MELKDKVLYILTILRKEGLEVIEACDARECIAEALQEKYNVELMDIIMSEMQIN